MRPTTSLVRPGLTVVTVAGAEYGLDDDDVHEELWGDDNDAFRWLWDFVFNVCADRPATTLVEVFEALDGIEKVDEEIRLIDAICGFGDAWQHKVASVHRRALKYLAERTADFDAMLVAADGARYWSTRKSGSTERLLYAACLRCAQEAGYKVGHARPVSTSVRRLQAVTGVSNRATLAAALRRLDGLGLVPIRRANDDQYLYHLTRLVGCSGVSPIRTKTPPAQAGGVPTNPRFSEHENRSCVDTEGVERRHDGHESDRHGESSGTSSLATVRARTENLCGSRQRPHELAPLLDGEEALRATVSSALHPLWGPSGLGQRHEMVYRCCAVSPRRDELASALDITPKHASAVLRDLARHELALPAASHRWNRGPANPDDVARSLGLPERRQALRKRLEAERAAWARRRSA